MMGISDFCCQALSFDSADLMAGSGGKEGTSPSSTGIASSSILFTDIGGRVVSFETPATSTITALKRATKSHMVYTGMIKNRKLLNRYTGM
jgi:hypothetical protein